MRTCPATQEQRQTTLGPKKRKFPAAFTDFFRSFALSAPQPPTFHAGARRGDGGWCQWLRPLYGNGPHLEVKGEPGRLCRRSSLRNVVLG